MRTPEFKRTGIIYFPAVSTWTDAESCSGEEKLWKGETDLATLTNDAGDFFGASIARGTIRNMFDNDASTFWQSDGVWRTKIIAIDFQVQILL